MNMDRAIEVERDRLLRRVEELDKKQNVLVMFGVDNHKVGRVLFITKTFNYNKSGHLYKYVAVKVAANSWYVTGREADQAKTWDQLVQFFVGSGTVVEITKMKKGERIL